MRARSWIVVVLGLALTALGCADEAVTSPSEDLGPVVPDTTPPPVDVAPDDGPPAPDIESVAAFMRQGTQVIHELAGRLRHFRRNPQK